MKLKAPSFKQIAIFMSLFFFYQQIQGNSSSLIQKVENYLSESKENNTNLKSILEGGTVQGFYSSKEVEEIFTHLAQKFKQFVQIKEIGKSFENRPINSYLLSSDFNNFKTKSKILFTGVHHARELLTAQMVIKIYLRSLHSLIHQTENNVFWIQNDMIIVPIINIDSHTLITESYGKENFQNYKWKRKNMNKNYCSSDVLKSGVDLNRNYGYHFADSNEGNDQCEEIYRGPYSFSEPETKAIKNLIDTTPNIVSAMNFHSYGDLWIIPFNYLEQNEEIPKRYKNKFIEFYNSFKLDVKEIAPNAQYGNAVQTVNYRTSGEASDWMLGEKEIISFSPELGSANPDAQDFIIPKDLIFESLKENYMIVDRFLQRNIFHITDLDYAVLDNRDLVLSFRNSGLNTLNKAYITLETSQMLIDNFSSLTYQNQYGIKQDVDKIDNQKNRQISFSVQTIERLEEFTLIITLNKDYKMIDTFPISLTIALEGGHQLVTKEMLVVITDNNTVYKLSLALTGIIVALVMYIWFTMTVRIFKKNKDQII